MGATLLNPYAHAVGGAALFSDDFNRADDATGLGGSYITVGNTMGISGNKAYEANRVVNMGGAVQEVGVSDGSVQAALSSLQGSAGLVARAIDADNGIWILFGDGSNIAAKIKVVTRIGGSIAVQGTSTLDHGIAFNGAASTAKVEIIGDELEVFVDGVSKYALTLSGTVQSALGAATKWGIGAGYDLAAYATRWDDLVIA